MQSPVRSKTVTLLVLTALLLTSCVLPTPPVPAAVQPATAEPGATLAPIAEPQPELDASTPVAAEEPEPAPNLSGNWEGTIAIESIGLELQIQVRFEENDDGLTGTIDIPDTQMMIGSTGKTLTTLLMATLVDEGVLTWDTPVIEILPDFAVADEELTRSLTVRNLVCACTGVPRRDFEMVFNAGEQDATAVITDLRTYEFFTAFGEAFQYSNQMVAAGGYAAAAATGQEGDLAAIYRQVLGERVLDPIGMAGTTLSFDTVEAGNNYAVPHGLNLDNIYYPIPLSLEKLLVPVAPAGAHWSTVNDMARYLLTLLNQGETVDGTVVVSPEQLDELWTPQVAITADDSYGLGWIVSDYKGLRLISHAGNTFGFTSELAFLPEADLGISILTNGRATNLFSSAVIARLLELVFAQEFEAEAQIAFAAEQIERQYEELADNLGTAAADAYAPFLSTFSNEALGTVTLEDREGSLILDAGEFRSELRPFLHEEAEEGRYLLFDMPLAGVNVDLKMTEEGAPYLILGSGVNEYRFDPVE